MVKKKVRRRRLMTAKEAKRKQIARMLGRSPSYYSKIFRRTTGPGHVVVMPKRKDPGSPAG